MTSSDASALFEIYGDAQAMKYTDEAPFENLATVSLMLSSVQKLLIEGKSLEWGIALKGSAKLIGTCGLHSFDESLQAAEIGCMLNRAAWGRGYMKEAINLLIAYARDVLGIKELLADVHPENEHAQRLFSSLKFQRGSPELWRLDT